MTSLKSWVDGVLAATANMPPLEYAPQGPCIEFSGGDPDLVQSYEHVLLRTVGIYTAYAIDLDYLWRWEIYQGADRLVQEGGSISLNSATEAVDHVLAYFCARDSNTICGPAGTHRP